MKEKLMQRILFPWMILLIYILHIPVFGQNEKPRIIGQNFLVNGASVSQAGIGAVTLELIFDKKMDQDGQAHPKVYFSQDSSFSAQLPVSPFWVADSIWHGLFNISLNVPSAGNGLYNFRFHGAKSAAGAEMDTTFGLVPLKICRPELSVISDLDFGSVAPGLSRQLSLVLKNKSCDTIVVDSLITVSPFSIENAKTARSVQADDSLEIPVNFSPMSRGQFSETIEIYGAQMLQNKISATVSGEAHGPLLSVSSETIDFGRVDLNKDSTQNLTIRNVASTNSAFNELLHFEISQFPDPIIYSLSRIRGDVLPGDSVEVAITFRPQESRLYNNYYLKLATNDKLHTEKMITLTGYNSDQSPPTRISNLQVEWGDIYEGFINEDVLKICWENPGSAAEIGQIRWKFSQSAAPPVNNDDLGKGGVLNLGENQNCASLSLAALSQGNWYAYLWLVDTAGNSGYEDFVDLQFKLDLSHPATPLLVQSNIMSGDWVSDLDSVEVKLKLASGGQISQLDVARVFIKFNSPPEDGYDFAEWSRVGSVQNGIAAFKFKFNPTECGPGTMYFWSADSAGNFSNLTTPLELNYKIDTCPPVITGIANTSLISARHGHAFRDTVHIDDERGVKRVWVEYRAAGTFNTKINEDSRRVFGTDDFIVTIPQNDIALQGMEYRILAEDSTALISFAENEQQRCGSVDSGWVALPTYVSGDGTKPMDESGTELPLTSGTDSTDYQLISIPFELAAPQIDSIFVDDLGEYKISKWRIFDYNTSAPSGQRWLEGDSARPFIPGRSYFIISTAKNLVYDTGRGKTRSTLCPDSIEVFEGWNLVATPFNFPVHSDALSLVNSNSPIVLYPYNSGWEFSDIMEPWQGYAIFVQRAAGAPINESIYLVVQPRKTSTSTAKSNSFFSESPAAEWSIKISATAGKSRDLHNWVGVRQLSKPGYDEFERAEPPLIGQYVSVSFHHPEWHQLTDRFSTDFRVPGAEEFIWEIDIRCNARNEIVKLNFDFEANVPENASVYLIDEQQKSIQNLRTTTQYQFLAVTEGSKKLKLVVGSEAFIEEMAADLALVPENFELLQNFPNPFNPETTIRFNVPQNGQVSLFVYNQLGQKVATLMNNSEIKSGYHSLIWRARDDRGFALPSGVYLIRIQFENQKAVKKVLLLR
ncbi:MAG: choice-of-anchor D domain-containing protein [Calditrichaeota bacterium]|nr:MAG: choice-of-anchor D domain-containing protein [Calditrichota bacterium]